MATAAMTRPGDGVIALMLALYHTPALASDMRDIALPADMILALRLAAGDGVALDQAAQQTGVDKRVLREAAVLLLEQAMFFDGADSYRWLGATPTISQDELRSHHRWLMHWLHPDRNPGSGRTVYSEGINRAWNDLRTTERRAAHDARMGVDVTREAAATTLASTLRPHWHRHAAMAPAPRLSGRFLRSLPLYVIGGGAVLTLGTLALMQAVKPTYPVVSVPAASSSTSQRAASAADLSVAPLPALPVEPTGLVTVPASGVLTGADDLPHDVQPDSASIDPPDAVIAGPDPVLALAAATAMTSMPPVDEVSTTSTLEPVRETTAQAHDEAVLATTRDEPSSTARPQAIAVSAIPAPVAVIPSRLATPDADVAREHRDADTTATAEPLEVAMPAATAVAAIVLPSTPASVPATDASPTLRVIEAGNPVVAEPLPSSRATPPSEHAATAPAIDSVVATTPPAVPSRTLPQVATPAAEPVAMSTEAAMTVAASTQRTPTAAAAEVVVGAMVDAFQRGNRADLLRLFAANTDTDLRRMAGEYDAVFADSGSRSLVISNLGWVIRAQDRTALGLGHFDIVYTAARDGALRVNSGPLQIEMRFDADAVRIVRLVGAR